MNNTRMRYCVADAIANLTRSKSAIHRTASYVKNADLIYLESNTIKKDKTLFFSADVLSLGAITFRHGKDIYGASSVIIDNTTVNCYNYTNELCLTCSLEHGLTIQGKTEIIIAVGWDSTASICITSNGKTFTNSEIKWLGTIGSIEMESIHTTMEHLSLYWDCANYAAPVWMFGDSYFTYYEERWPYYTTKHSNNYLLSGFPGATSGEIYPDFQQGLSHGTPKIAVWCLGMNDPDPEDGINPQWLCYTQHFISDCEDRGIVPVLSTVPNVPERLHIHKNAFVRNSGYRYIDFASAVGANEKGSSWHTQMLSADQVHPAVAGAQTLAKQVLLDLPEIKE